MPGPAPDATAVADVVRAIAAAARSGTQAQRAARHLVKILSAADSLTAARQAVNASSSTDRAAMGRLLDAAVASTSAATIERIAAEVDEAWRHLHLAAIIGGTEPDSDLQSEALAVLKGRMRQTASYFTAQLAEASARAEDARQCAERAMDIAQHRAERAEERAGTALDGLVMQSLDSRIDPSGFYVYLLWGDDETRPLYVGQSANFLSRLGSHMSDPGKRHRIRSVTVIRCQTERQMDTTELRLIRKYRPALNTAGVPRDVEVQ